MNKTQAKRAYIAIKNKARRLWGVPLGGAGPWGIAMTTQDMVAIEKICDKYLKKF